VIWVKLQALHCVRLGSFGGGVLHNYCSICRLNLKFESSAIHTYFCLVLVAVRNAIDDLGFLDQVIGIELSDLGQVTGIALRQTWVLWGRCISQLLFYFRVFCYAYVLYVSFVNCAQCNGRFGFFEVRL